MESDLARHIRVQGLVDTHEHLRGEREWVDEGPDILQDLFGGYVQADLAVAGASAEAVRRCLDSGDGDFEGRFAGIEEAWKRSQFTGYGEAVRLVGKVIYGLDVISGEGLAGAQEQLRALRADGERLRLLRDVAGIDHVQVDNFTWVCEADPEGSEFFLSDLGLCAFVSGELFSLAGGKTGDLAKAEAELGMRVTSLDDLGELIEAMFERYGARAIAVKTQHAYRRPLSWEPRTEADARGALYALLRDRGKAKMADKLCLGDWCLARIAELAKGYNLPIKIHTGYFAGHGYMDLDWLRPGLLGGLLKAYPETTFVLMHLGYPYVEEMVAIAKHFPNVYADLCWAWSINPYQTRLALRSLLHAVPTNKVFAFGGDTVWPTSVLAYSIQARQGIERALLDEVTEGFMSEGEAMEVATAIMYGNQYAAFDVEGTRAALRGVG